MSLNYTPDKDTKVHEQGAIRLICAGFQTHENGLPEWIKNASDEYGRRDARPESRVVLVLLRSQTRSMPASISVLDFNGMTSSGIEDDFRIWADPEASQRRNRAAAGAMQGGLGNGGKCYMTMLFQDYAILHTVKNRSGNRYGVKGGAYQFGYVPDRASGRRYSVPDPQKGLVAALAGIGVKYDALPDDAKNAFAKTKGFTLVTGMNPKGYSGRIPVTHLIEALRDHPQMIRSLEFCRVYVIYNGSPVPNAAPLQPEAVTPDPAFANDRVIAIPDELVDPVSGTKVSTTEGGRTPAGTLTLKTSDVSMRYSRKARHLIIYRAQSGYIGSKPVIEFDVNSPFRERIYGEFELLSLEESRQNTRQDLAESPLTRAVEAFIATQIEALAREFEERSRRQYDQQEKDGLSKMNEALDRWKNQFMSTYLAALFGQGRDGGSPPPPPPPLPSGVAKTITVSLAHEYSGIGVSFRPVLRFWDKDGTRIRPVPYRWVSEDTNVAWVDDDLNIVSTFAAGSTRLWAETLDGKVTSNRVSLEVVELTRIRLSPEMLEVPIGSRRSLLAECDLANGITTSDVYLVWFETSPVVAQVSASGNVYGHSLGTTEVAAGDDNCMADAVRVQVTEAGGGDGDHKGRGYPRILVSGVDKDPETGEDVEVAPDDPPVYQRPVDIDRDIWWINSAAPLGRLYLDQSKGFGYRE